MIITSLPKLKKGSPYHLRTLTERLVFFSENKETWKASQVLRFLLARYKSTEVVTAIGEEWGRSSGNRASRVRQYFDNRNEKRTKDVE